MSDILKDFNTYSEIINTIGRWKIIGSKHLHKRLNISMGYRTLKKKVLTLEREKIIRSISLEKNMKYLFLTNKGIEFTENDSTYEPCDETLFHDLTVGKAVQELLEYSKVGDAKMYHQISESLICPDAILTVNNKKSEFNIALEIELTQKSKKRVQNKFQNYARSTEYDYCVFVSHKTQLIGTYKAFLSEMDREVQERIFLVFNNDLLGYYPHFKNALCYYKDEEIDFSKLFGVKNTVTAVVTTDDSHLRTTGETLM